MADNVEIRAMVFEQSTHLKNWLFSEDVLAAKRAETNAEATARIREARVAAGGDDVEYLTADEERLLLRYYEHKIAPMCRALDYPLKVIGSALSFFKRFYVVRSCMDYAPKDVMVTCVCIAAKTEEVLTLTVEEFVDQVGVDLSTVLRLEVRVLDALSFHLVVWHPFHPMHAFLNDVYSSLAGNDAQPSVDILKAIRETASERACALLESDVSLVYPPSQIGLAALLEETRANPGTGIDIEAYIRAKFSDGDGDAEFLLTTSDAILALAAATGGGDVDVEAVRSTDLKLRHCRNPELDPESDVFKQKEAERLAAKDQRDRARQAKANEREERGIAELTGFNADGTRADGGGGGGGGGGDDDDDDDSDDGFSIRTTL